MNSNLVFKEQNELLFKKVEGVSSSYKLYNLKITINLILLNKLIIYFIQAIEFN